MGCPFKTELSVWLGDREKCSGRRFSGEVSRSCKSEQGAHVALMGERSQGSVAVTARRKAPSDAGVHLEHRRQALRKTARRHAAEVTALSKACDFAPPGRPHSTESCHGQVSNISRTAGNRVIRSGSRSTSAVRWQWGWLSSPASYNTTVLRTIDPAARVLPHANGRVNCRRPRR